MCGTSACFILAAVDRLYDQTCLTSSESCAISPHETSPLMGYKVYHRNVRTIGVKVVLEGCVLYLIQCIFYADERRISRSISCLNSCKIPRGHGKIDSFGHRGYQWYWP